MSNEKINKLGDRLRKKSENDDLVEFNNWRFGHNHVLSKSREMLKNKIKNLFPEDKDILISQRLKRTQTIIHKLKRFPKMQLSRVQDIAGLRVILKDISDVDILFKQYNLDEGKKNKKKQKIVRYTDYITKPKDSGYRGIHIIMEREDINNKQKKFKAELQIRSNYQHLWATAVETVGFFLNQGLKFSEGNDDIKDFFQLVSSGFALLEKTNILPEHECYEEAEIIKLIKDKYTKINFQATIKEINAISNLFNNIEQSKRKKSALITLCYNDENTITNTEVKYYSQKQQVEAQEKLLILDQLQNNNNSVLVSINDINNLKKAYPNYFLDISEFSKIIKEKFIDTRK